MNGKELILKATRGEATPRAAWLPFVGCHGGFLIGKTATEYLKSAALIVEGTKKAKELYKPDGLPFCFDLQIEAEVLGCDLHWADDVPPSVTTHPLEQGKTLATLPAFEETKGRIPVVLEALRMLKKEMGDDIALYGLLCGPFTLALHLVGNDIFLKMFDNPDDIKEVMEYCTRIACKMSDWYLRDGSDVVAIVDPMTSQISPDMFEEFVAPYVNKVCDHIRAKGGLSALFVCGDVTRNLEPMLATTCDALHVDEQIDMAAFTTLATAAKKGFGGNIPLTVALLLGTEDSCQRAALSILDTCGSQGFILAPGCDLPYNVPPKNLEAVTKMVHDTYARDTVRATKSVEASDAFDDIILPDYTKKGVVRVDLITLDSTSCAPCQYMTDAAERAAKAAKTGDVKVEVVEHKIKVREGIGMMVKLGVKALPTLCIDGNVLFISLIPDQPTLIAAIEKAAAQKQM
ncbi:MAG: uroporphyrinogen decarboxylase family protein [Kiritimatiellaeota bacterium]|nr:uroporphyrinogen decarboxylase family protein [Kiritimatiellota bacterium]